MVDKLNDLCKFWQLAISEYKKSIVIYRTAKQKHKVLSYKARIDELEGCISEVKRIIKVT